MLLVLISVFSLIPVQVFAQTEESEAVVLEAVNMEEEGVVLEDEALPLPNAAASDKSLDVVPSAVEYVGLTPSRTMTAELGDTVMNENEYNDSIEYANTIKDDYTIIGTFGKDTGDPDFYKFTLAGKRQVDITCINYRGNTLNFAIYNSNGKQLKMCSYNGTFKDSDGETYHQDSLQYLSLSKGTYYIRVWDNSWWNYAYLMYINTMPITPKITGAENTSNGIKIKWEASPGAKNYRVYRRTYSSTEVSFLNNTVATHFTDTSAVKGRTYVYYVVSWDTNNTAVSKINESKDYTFTRLGVPKISSLTNTKDGVQIKWAKVTGATGYKIYRQKKGASSWTLIKTISKQGTTSYTDTSSKLTNGTTYRYRVRAYYKNSNVYGDKLIYSYGNIKTTVRLARKSITTLVADGPKSCLVYWNTNSKANGYQIRVTRNGNTFKTFTISGKDTMSAQLTGMKTGVKYGVKIRSYKTVSGTKYYSAWSPVKYVTCY